MSSHIQAIILGVIQGLGEFLPISSSAHLILVPKMLNWNDLGQTFDVALHIGTLSAVLIYFKNDILKLIKEFLNSFKNLKDMSFEAKLGWYVIIATIPGAILGKKFEYIIEDNIRNSPILISVLLIIMGFILLLADKYGKKTFPITQLNFKNAIIIGLAQALALIPGFSRSGITITAALLLGYTKDAAAYFSFLLSIPIILGAGTLKTLKIYKSEIDNFLVSQLLLGIVSAFIVGYLAIHFLLNYIKKHDFKIFAIYRFIFGLFVILYFLFNNKN